MTFNPDRTEVLMISNMSIPHININFNNQAIPIIDSHKHLAVSFIQNDKWNTHIDNIMKT